MTVVRFPKRPGHKTPPISPPREAVSFAKATLTMWLLPGLFWLSVLDFVDKGSDRPE